MKKVVDLMLDSGAFGAWKRDEVLDFRKYMDYVEEHKEWFYSYVNMDVIPGSLGKMNRTQAEVEHSAQASYKNLQVMKKRGLSPIPVFHQGEDFKWLERLLADGEPYIGISPYMRSNQSTLIDWLDRCFTLLTDEKGMPYVKTHGFGATGQLLLLRYPWFSCDSTSWTMAPSYGQIPVPIYEADGKANYYRRHQSIIISDRPANNGAKAKSYDNLGPMARQQVERFLREEVGISVFDARYDPNLRRRAYLRFYLLLMQNARNQGFKHRRASMHAKLPRGMKAQKPWPVKLIFATGPWHGQYNDLMTKVGANNRLISYYDVRKDQSFDIISHTVKTGLLIGWRPNETPGASFKNETYRIKRIFNQAYRIGIKPHEHNRFLLTPRDPDDDQERNVSVKAATRRASTRRK